MTSVIRDKKKNFIDCELSFLGIRNHIKEMLGISLTSGSCTELFHMKNEADKLFASNLTWVIGDGLCLCINAVSSVNNPSPLTHENY